MRLLQLHDDGEFRLTNPLLDDKLPAYAILSHRWGDDGDEVTFEDLADISSYKSKAGYDKIKFCAEQAGRDGLRYFWVDSCCIRRSSDAELSEAINSMFRWYRGAAKCYVYLKDVSSGASQSQQEAAFRGSDWFTRGWTLQELIAPPTVLFFSKEGELMGDKNSLRQKIYEITSIPLTALSGSPLSTFSVKERMRWAAERKTTRKEDRAYCLLGIFDVFIPPIYGEGDNAFTRLQEAINSRSNGEEERIDMHNKASDRGHLSARLPIRSSRNKANEKRPFPKTPEARKDLLNSLTFERIEDRYNNIKLAHSATCQWLLNNNNYQSWIDEKQVRCHNGLLWLKGKPGAGKSTIIKYAITEAKRSRKEDIHISCFFNARGSLLEKDTRGMYRSLLFQLLTKFPQAQEVFEEFDILELPQAPRYTWTVIQLKEVMNCAIQKLGKRWLWIYVDALDECDEDQIRDMVVFFEQLGRHTAISKINLRVFFASRYYPRIVITKKVELLLEEEEEEHALDIERYIRSELRTGLDVQSTAIERIRGEVKRRASGVFIWVVLVVQILNKAYDHGRILGLEKRLQDIPDDLGQLFRGIMTRDDQNMESMRLCINWILFAKRPLTREELYFAIYSGIDSEEAGCRNSEGLTTEDMDAFILSCSKGLAELTQSRKPTVQFIHETIRDFLLKDKGMQYIQETSTQSLIGSGHNYLKECCVNYVSSAQKSLSKDPPVDVRFRGTAYTPQRTSPKPPFIGYALLHIFYHANAAQENGVSQEMFFREFSVQHWINLTKMFADPGAVQTSKPRSGLFRTYSPNQSMLSILARENLASLIKTILEFDPQADIEGTIDDSPLRIALDYKNYAALRALLTPAPAQNCLNHPTSLIPPCQSELDSLIQNYRYSPRERRSSQSVLYLYFQWGTKSDIAVLLRSGRFRSDASMSATIPCSPLSVAAERGYEDIVRSLLEQQDVDPNSQDYLGLTPLSRAIREGRQNLVSLLVESMQIDINLKCAAGRSPLSYAAEAGHEQIFQLIINHPDVRVNSRDNKGRTPFFYAAMHGREAIVGLLIKLTGVDIISRDYIGHTALSYASMNGHKNVVRQLLETGNVDVNSRDTMHGRTPLLFALEYGYITIAMLLLEESELDVHLANNRGRTPLDYAQDKRLCEVERIIKLRILTDGDTPEEFQDALEQI